MLALMLDASSKGALAAHYDGLWEEAAPAVQAGRAALDPWLSPGQTDARRGLTLLAWPSSAITGSIDTLLEQLRSLEPEQTYQPTSDQHHTVLSLFTATPDYAPFMARVAEYHDAVSEVAASTPPFEIEVRGVTLTRGAVLAQGFPRDDTLSVLRDRLRRALPARGLGESLDQRYRLVTAHMTIVRFAKPLRDCERFVAALAAARQTDFGLTRVDRLNLVFGDWFHTAEREERIADFGLR